MLGAWLCVSLGSEYTLDRAYCSLNYDHLLYTLRPFHPSPLLSKEADLRDRNYLRSEPDRIEWQRKDHTARWPAGRSCTSLSLIIGADRHTVATFCPQDTFHID